ncbi:MAG: hypothetical protein RSE93_08910, partial [Oscillospiraceae bacterium]
MFKKIFISIIAILLFSNLIIFAENIEDAEYSHRQIKEIFSTDTSNFSKSEYNIYQSKYNRAIFSIEQKIQRLPNIYAVNADNYSYTEISILDIETLIPDDALIKNISKLNLLNQRIKEIKQNEAKIKSAQNSLTLYENPNLMNINCLKQISENITETVKNNSDIKIISCYSLSKDDVSINNSLSTCKTDNLLIDYTAEKAINIEISNTELFPTIFTVNFTNEYTLINKNGEIIKDIDDNHNTYTFILLQSDDLFFCKPNLYIKDNFENEFEMLYQNHEFFNIYNGSDTLYYYGIKSIPTKVLIGEKLILLGEEEKHIDLTKTNFKSEFMPIEALLTYKDTSTISSSENVSSEVLSSESVDASSQIL